MSYLDAVPIVCGPPPRGAAWSSGVVRLGNQHAGVGYVRPDRTTFLATKSDLRAEALAIEAEGKTLDQDVRALPSPAADRFKAGWASFYAALEKALSDAFEKADSWVAFGVPGTILGLRDYGEQLNDWRAHLVRFGVVPTAPPVEPRQERPDDKAVPWKPIVIAAVAIAGVAAGGYALANAGRIAGMLSRDRQ